MSVHIARAQLLIERSRFKDAEDELRQAIAANPEDAFAHSLLAISLSRQEKHKEAIQEAQAATGLAPDSSYSLFALAIVLYDQDRYKEAQSAIQEAIRMDPEDPRYYRILSSIHLQKRAWQDALTTAEEGLRIDPEDVGLTNLRATALVKLGRKREAGLTIDAALAREPDNATTHANQGWALLHRGEHEKAMEHFREALRLNPMLVWAQQGIVEALKARNPVYRVMLKYFLWMSRLGSRAQWGVILGAYVLFRIVYSISASNPELEPILKPLIYLYLAFALLTWISGPLFDLLLRLNRFGRLALSKDKIIASNWVGACLLLALVMLIGGISLSNGTLLEAALKSAAMIIPVAGVFKGHSGKSRATLAILTILLGAVGTGGIIFSLAGSPSGSALGTLFWLGWVLYSWIANLVLSVMG